MSGYRVLDIETVVDRRYWDPPPTRWRQEPVDYGNREDLRSGAGDRAAPTIWYPEEPFPPPQAHKVVAMAWVNLSGDDGKWYSLEDAVSLFDWEYGLEGDVAEKKMLEAFGAAQSGDEACIVTWNGRTFDLPVINMRSFLHHLPCEWYYKESDVRYRYTEAGHCDLMDVFGDYGAGRSMKLGDVAKLCGLPGKIGDVTGAGVKDLYDAFNPSLSRDAKSAKTIAHVKALAAARAAVGAYCLLDAVQTAIIFGRSRVHKGMIDFDYWRSVVAPSFDELLSKTVADVLKKKVA